MKQQEPLSPMDLIFRLLVGSISFSVCTVAMLLAILLDLASPYENAYERMRIAVELLALLGITGLTLWTLVYRRPR